MDRPRSRAPTRPDAMNLSSPFQKNIAIYGAISGAQAGLSQLAKAAGPLAVAAVIQADSSPTVLFGMLLACALASFVFFLLAIRSQACPPLSTTLHSP